MRLTRVHVDTALEPGSVVELPADGAAHVAKVLRARSGDALILFNGDGLEFTGTVVRVRGAQVSAAVGEAHRVDRESPLALTLVQCVPRGDRMDLIVQKATELGVARIVPVLSQRSVVRLDAKQGEAKMAHWRAIAVGACEQCGRNRVPRIEAPRPLIHFLGDAPMNPVRLVLEPDLEPNGAMQRIADAVEIAIGPEGGFSADELEGFRISGYLRVRLGPRTLRAETAAIAALAWLQARFGDMQPGNFEPGRLSEYSA